MALAIRENTVGEGWPDAGEASQLRCRGTVSIDPLGGPQRPDLLPDLVTVSYWVAVACRVEELGGDRWGARCGGCGTQQVASKDQGEQDSERSALAAGDGGEEVFHPGRYVREPHYNGLFQRAPDHRHRSIPHRLETLQ